MQQMQKLYKTDSKGKTRVWWAEIDDDRYRVVSGIVDGKLIESAWKTAKPKNEGRANATTGAEQAIAEVEALYKKQLAQGRYHNSIDNVDEETYIAPMLAATYADVVPIDFTQALISQPKLDGFRCIATKDGLFTRKGKRFISSPHIEFALIELFQRYPDVVLDGELYNHDLHDDFNSLSSLLRKQKPTAEDLENTARVVEYHVYDMIDTSLKTVDRLSKLEDIFIEFNLSDEKIRMVESSYVADQEELDDLFAKYVEAGYEGQMIRYNKKYVHKRTKDLIKRKEFFDEEVIIVDIIEGEGNWAGMAKSLTIQLSDGTIASSGIRGNREFATKLLVNRHLYLGNGSQATIRYPNKTPGGKPRFPVAVAIYRGGRDS